MKIELLKTEDWDNLKASKLVKPLKTSDWIYELRIKGNGRFGQRLFFFVTDCRGKTECVVTEVEARANLNVTGSFAGYIRRGEEMRTDWMKRNCKVSQ